MKHRPNKTHAHAHDKGEFLTSTIYYVSGPSRAAGSGGGGVGRSDNGMISPPPAPFGSQPNKVRHELRQRHLLLVQTFTREPYKTHAHETQGRLSRLPQYKVNIRCFKKRRKITTHRKWDGNICEWRAGRKCVRTSGWGGSIWADGGTGKVRNASYGGTGNRRDRNKTSKVGAVNGGNRD